jgi:hypothetical protein
LKLLADKEVAVADIAPMLGAILGVSKTPKGQDKKRAKKSKGEKSVTEPEQQHGELLNSQTPVKPISDHKLIKENAKREMRHAVDSWVSGHVTTKEVAAVHARARHVLSGKRPHEFKGQSGERKMKLSNSR